MSRFAFKQNLMSLKKKFTLIIFVVFAIFLGALSLNTDSDAGNVSVIAGLKKISTSSRAYRIYDPLIESYDSLIKTRMREENIPGLALSIVKDNQVLLMKGYGVKEFGGKDSIDINTIFRIGSVSKGFASVLAAIYVNEKKINWDDKIIDYVPDFCLNDTSCSNQMTIRHILSHSTGLPTHTFTDRLDYNVPYEQIKPLLKEVPLAYKPGKNYSYQNVAYSLIADVLQSATGSDYSTLVKNKIFVPLYMKHASSDYLTIATDTNVAKPHIQYGALKWKPLKLNDRYYSVGPASGINASISDMTQWLMALMGNYPDLISAETLEEVFKPQIVTQIKRNYRNNWNNLGELYYGLGWRIFEYEGRTIVYHGGYVKGYRAEMAFDCKEKTGIVVLFNSPCKLSNMCIPRFFDLYYHFLPSETILAKK